MTSSLDIFALKGHTALVTGAARGLGKAMASALAGAGANIVIVDLNLEGAQSVAQNLAGVYGIQTAAFPGDVSDPEDIEGIIADVIQRFGTLDILVNNAGVAKHVAAKDMTLEDWNALMNVNLTGVFVCSQAAAKPMEQQGGGSIINIASMSGFIVNIPQPQAAYNTSKAGVIHLTKSLAVEWAPHNIRVNAICPGYMETEMTAPLMKQETAKRYWIGGTPMQRVGKPEELAGAVIYFASQASSFVTGSALTVDGGYTLL